MTRRTASTHKKILTFLVLMEYFCNVWSVYALKVDVECHPGGILLSMDHECQPWQVSSSDIIKYMCLILRKAVHTLSCWNIPIFSLVSVTSFLSSLSWEVTCKILLSGFNNFYTCKLLKAIPSALKDTWYFYWYLLKKLLCVFWFINSSYYKLCTLGVGCHLYF